ncbi:MAG TPA: DUF1800 domain-containing protein, partial [Anaerolineae bacterium]
ALTPTPINGNPPTTPEQAALRTPALDWLAANRLMFGPGASDLQHIDEIGLDNFIEEQLASSQPDDTALQARLQSLETLTMLPVDLAQAQRSNILLELQQATLLRAVYAKRQLFEVLVDFWTNHFNIYFQKNTDHYLKTVDDREVIRPHAMGKFRDILGASAHSPAMLVYLDNVTNRKVSSNENYGRELMELHTISVNGGYTQADVKEVARAFTGWTAQSAQGANPGAFIYNPRMHDDDAKTILGQALPLHGGQQDGEHVLDLLAQHANCAQFIASKLARRFISDIPPASVISLGAEAFTRSAGDIKATLSAILHSDDFKHSSGQKLKRPLELIASALRGLDADTDGAAPLQNFLTQMGQPLFLWQSPDGYPDVSAAWSGADAVLARWNYGIVLGRNGLKGTQLNLNNLISNRSADPITGLSMRLFGAALPADVQRVLEPFASDLPTLAALLVAAPIFQIRG